MALTKCPDCDGTVSDLADSCPHCGRPLEKFAPAMVEERESKRRAQMGELPPRLDDPWKPKPKKRSGAAIVIGVLLVMLFLVLAVELLDSGPKRRSTPRPSSGSRSNPDKLACLEYRTVGKAAIEAVTVNPVIEKDMCWKDPPRGVYEAFVKTRSASGRSAHWKITFNSYNARSGVYELCQDARTGSWECQKP